ncbi:2-keto-4-pentenoate hydratase [Actinomycetospora rhizophila]|uniref:2-keto-4-pentenoate hydratase n=1 Tax=Actinomycetospora rhizophila TaxID=1416876 RepID=A0ABV9ZCJ2_9PSEU
MQEAADRLLDAAATGAPCAPLRDLIGTDDVDAAYAVQRRLTAHRTDAGARVVGRKIGLTNPAVQAQLGVDSPDFGVLFDDMAVDHDGTVAAGRLLQPRIEAEVAFVLGADLDGEITDATVRAAVDHQRAALEIVDSRIAGWDITFGDTVADNGSSGLYVLGPEQVALRTTEPVGVTRTLERAGGTVSEGTGAACLGDPLAALAWLARTARDLGDPLRAGDVVLSGALGPMVPVEPGDRFTARITGLGDVAITFAKENP